ncbi:3-methyladenine DNA glycosylase [Nocardioides zeae]|uniref:3-methyladenine DNA glycosylase n=1 Tax=Nocardioides imazamoxiresistens TaxID=3231893 RepID=A0ABU3PXG2_9ACTN|nr:3-methyladenine DNA glycosylase [Nocardioides zeae]MDT9593928.1 3-methyladenine DNA glycosylase [Nocardioides zeae]
MVTTAPDPVQMQAPVEVLSEAELDRRRDAHEARVDAFVAPHLARRSERVKHPVHDFLFTYYSQRPAQLRRWHPGHGVRVPASRARAYAGLKGYVVDPDGTTTVGEAHVRAQRPLLEALVRLLRATAARPANLGCFGLHEWAMVYGLTPEEVRHADWPLRLGAEGTDRVVEGHRIACSHFDAYRFFTPAARPLNQLAPSAGDREAHEQPGCLHAGMDLYKHAFRLTPMVCSDLVADCFALARDIRETDMRAAPYDLRALGFEPIRVETAEGKRAYADLQRSYAERGAPLRARLVAECERLLAVADG